MSASSLLSFFVLFLSLQAAAQVQDFTTTQYITSTPPPGRVALQSALLPGLGQVTNGQWWKAPIIYAGLGTLTGFIIYNHREFKKYQTAYAFRTDGDSSTIDKYDFPNQSPPFSQATLLLFREETRRNRDLSAIVLGVVYAANILDAYVFAQLKDFDVSDDLSFSPRISPTALQTNGVGVKLTLHLNK